MIRYGSRLGDLEKKLAGAYRDAVCSSYLFIYLYCSPLSTQTTVEALDDEALFGIDEDEEEDGAFVMYVNFFCITI